MVTTVMRMMMSMWWWPSQRVFGKLNGGKYRLPPPWWLLHGGGGYTRCWCLFHIFTTYTSDAAVLIFQYIEEWGAPSTEDPCCRRSKSPAQYIFVYICIIYTYDIYLQKNNKKQTIQFNLIALKHTFLVHVKLVLPLLNGVLVLLFKW